MNVTTLLINIIEKWNPNRYSVNDSSCLEQLGPAECEVEGEVLTHVGADVAQYDDTE